jgi:RHS repeat-associated protein
MPCPPRGTCPRSTAGAPAASFIGDVPEQNCSRDATAWPMSPHKWARRQLGARTEKSQFPRLYSAISGHRYYNPTWGRFINRDPAEEAGGINLYAFCKNDGINGYDLGGLSPNDGFTGDDGGIPIISPPDDPGYGSIGEDPGQGGSNEPIPFPGIPTLPPVGPVSPPTQTHSQPPGANPLNPNGPMVLTFQGITLTQFITAENFKTGQFQAVAGFSGLPANANGLIIQSITIHESFRGPNGYVTTDASGRPSPIDYTGFEAWQVQNGVIGETINGKFEPLSFFGEAPVGDTFNLPGYLGKQTLVSGSIETITTDMVFVPGSGAPPSGWEMDTNRMLDATTPSGYYIWYTQDGNNLPGWNPDVGLQREFSATYSTTSTVVNGVPNSWTLTQAYVGYIAPPSGYNPLPPPPPPVQRSIPKNPSKANPL